MQKRTNLGAANIPLPAEELGESIAPRHRSKYMGHAVPRRCWRWSAASDARPNFASRAPSSQNIVFELTAESGMR